MNVNNNFAKQSLDVNLFFLRIMKEHALFLAVGFIPNYSDYYKEALNFNNIFNQLLIKAVDLSRGVTAINNDAVTDLTLDAEKAVQKATLIHIDTNLTQTELSLRDQSLNRININELTSEIRQLNDRAISATRNLIRYKTKILDDVLSCRIMYNVYPLLIEHIRREAILFVETLTALQNNVSEQEINKLIENEIFWNKIMEEHSEFIRGLLDPKENELIKVANDFAVKFENLNKNVYKAATNPNLVPSVTKESINLTKQVRDFNTDATKGLLNCQIRSILNPLLGDHVLRESNHYLRLLERK